VSEVWAKASVERSIPWDSCSLLSTHLNPYVGGRRAPSQTRTNLVGYQPLRRTRGHAWTKRAPAEEDGRGGARPGGERRPLGRGHQSRIGRRPRLKPGIAVSLVAAGSHPSRARGPRSPLGLPPEPTVPGVGPPPGAPSGSRLHGAGRAAGPTPYPVAPACGRRQALALPSVSSSRSARRRMSARL
jgi:hypothetical protein